MPYLRVAVSASLLGMSITGVVVAQPPKETPSEATYGGKSLSQWLTALENTDVDGRKRAISALRALGGNPDVLAERLLIAAGGENPKARSFDHIEALVALGPSAVPTITRGLWSGNKQLRQVSLYTLLLIGPDGRAATPSVIRLLADPDDLTRRECANVLETVENHSAIPALTGSLKDTDAVVRLTAAQALVRLGADASLIVPAVKLELNKDDPELVRKAVLVLHGLGPEAAATVTELSSLVARDDPVLTIRVASTLAGIGPAAKDAVPALKKRLAEDKHHGHEIGLDVAIALWRIARDPEALRILREQLANSSQPQRVAEELWRIDSGEETVEALTAHLKSEKPEVAIAAAGILGSKAKGALPLLGRMLAHTEPNHRARAVVALVRLGSDAKEAIEPLRGSMKDDNPDIAFWSAVAVCRLDPTAESVARVAGYLDHASAQLRLSAADVLGRLGPKAAPAAPRLLAARASEDGHVRLAAAMAAWKANSDPAALQSASELLKSPDPLIRSLAAVDICSIAGPQAKPMVPDLVKRLFDSFASVRSSVAEGLGRIGPGAAEAVPALLALLEGDEPGFVQSAACEALGLIRPVDKESASAVLNKKLNHPDPHVRIHAALALWRLAGDDSGVKEAERGLGYRTYQVRITAAELLWAIKKDGRVIPLLTRSLAEGNLDGRSTENERYMAARALGRLGAAANAALPELRRLLTHPDTGLAEVADEAIRAIEGAGKK